MAGQRGRPEIGGHTHVRLGDLADKVEEWAAERGLKKGEAIRLLIQLGLDRSRASAAHGSPEAEQSK